MDQKTPLPYKEDRFDFLKVLNRLITLAFLFFVAYLVDLIRRQGEEQTLVIFMEIRNKAYLVFAGVLLVLGFWKMTSAQKKELSKSDPYSQLVPTLIVALLGITFSYAAALLLNDILKLFNLF